MEYLGKKPGAITRVGALHPTVLFGNLRREKFLLVRVGAFAVTFLWLPRHTISVPHRTASNSPFRLGRSASERFVWQP